MKNNIDIHTIEIPYTQPDEQSWIEANKKWLQENKGKYQCPYCGRVFSELSQCCGEMHGEIIGLTMIDVEKT